MDSACRGHFRLRIQEVPKSLEADKEYRLLILSLLRMPISPLRRGRVINVTSCRSMRQQSIALRLVCNGTQQTFTSKSLLSVTISIASNVVPNQRDLWGLPS